MKPYTYALLAVAAACGVASAQTSATTTPVGYVTQTLGANKFSFVGLTVHNPVVSAGVIDAVSANSITDTGVDFSTLLTQGATYILELGNGTIQEVTAWTNAGVLTTPENLTSQVTAGTTTYTLRKAATISEVFGATNSAGLAADTDGDYLTGNDVIYVPGAGGAVTQVFYFDDGAGTTGWFDSNFNDASKFPLVYADGFYVKRGAGNPISLVTTGEVKKAATAGVLNPSWNFLSSVAPVGLTVGNSGLQSYLSADATGDYSTADNIYIPNADGSFTIAFYFNDGAGTQGWFDSSFNDASTLGLEGAFLILNRGAAKSYKLSVPASYSNL